MQVKLPLFLFLLLFTSSTNAWVNAQTFSDYDQAKTETTPEVERTSFYIPMRDGTKLAVDLYKPAVTSGTKLPALVETTRYWRRIDNGKTAAEKQVELDANSQEVFFAKRGYVVVKVDARGTGASFGKHIGPWGPAEVQDGFDICEWIVKQPWSNGRVGSYGVSYGGTSAALMAATGHESVKIVIPAFTEFDIYRNIAYPGGVFNEKFVQVWSMMNDALDHNEGTEQIFGLKLQGPAPVDSDTKRELVNQAIAQHKHNPSVFELAMSAQFLDSKMQSVASSDGWTFSDRSVINYVDQIKKSKAFVYTWGSWMDAQTSDVVLSNLEAFAPNVRIVIGPWSHGAEHHASPFLDPSTESKDSLKMTVGWLKAFDYFLKDKPNGFLGTAPVTYYTMGSETWHSADSWPPYSNSDSKNPTRLYFKSDNQLSQLLTATEKRPSLTYDVDFSATTGKNNRWFTQLDNDVVYPTDETQSQKRRCFTSQPLTEAYEITGEPVVRVKLSSNRPENRIAVYLEAIAPEGKVIYLTEGHLDARHRGKASESGIPLNVNRTFNKADALTYKPGQSMILDVPLIPTSVILQPGYRIRLSLAGHDAETFTRIPETGEVRWQIESDSSFIELPMILWNGKSEK